MDGRRAADWKSHLPVPIHSFLTAPACKQTGGCSALGHVHHMPRAFSAGVADFIVPVRSLPTDRLKPVIGETEGRDVDINARHSKSPVVRILGYSKIYCENEMIYAYSYFILSIIQKIPEDSFFADIWRECLSS